MLLLVVLEKNRKQLLLFVVIKLKWIRKMNHLHSHSSSYVLKAHISI